MTISSEDYLEVSIRLSPFSEETAEMVMAEVAELPYSAFVSEAPFLKCYIQKEDYRPQELKAVLSGFAEYSPLVSAVPVPPANWNAAWEGSFEPIVVDGAVTIRAPFNENVPRTRYNILIEPKMAFGTGSHHTTCMIISEMLSLRDRIRGGAVLDMGCGTAVLAILAAKMGAAKVTAVDIDAVAARSAWGNARWNRVGTKVEVRCGDASLLQAGSYDVILANINRNILLQDLPTYSRSLKKGGILVSSGFFTSDEAVLAAAAGKAGLERASLRSSDCWCALTFTKR